MSSPNPDLLERVLSAVVYLYGAVTRRDFFDAAVMCLQSNFGNSDVSIVSKGRSEGTVVIEASTVLVTRSAADCRAESLYKILEAEKIEEELTGDTIVLAGQEVSVHAVRLIPGRERPILLLFHDGLEFAKNSEDSELVAYFLDHVEMVYQRVSDREALRIDLDVKDARLDAIRRFTERLGTLDINVLISQLLEVCMFLTEAQVGSVRLPGALESVEAEWGLPKMILESLKDSTGDLILRDVVQKLRGRIVDDIETFPGVAGVPVFRVASFLCVPIVVDDRCLGTINLVMAADAVRTFSQRDLLAIEEISTLAGVAIENARLHRESLEQQRIQDELKIAQTIQSGMYPTSALDLPGYDCAWLNESCDETGGDYLDFLYLMHNRLIIAIGDVSGHGIGAAMLMAAGRANLRALFSVKHDLNEVTERLNNLMESDMDASRFMTLFIGCLEFESGSLSYVNAGHDCPLHYSHESGEITEFSSSGLPIGMYADWTYDPAARIDFRPGDALLLTTDGVWETANPKRERYGKERMGELLRRHIDCPAAKIVDAIVRDVHGFAGGLPADDDRTLLIIKKAPDPPSPDSVSP